MNLATFQGLFPLSAGAVAAGSALPASAGGVPAALADSALLPGFGSLLLREIAAAQAPAAAADSAPILPEFQLTMLSGSPLLQAGLLEALQTMLRAETVPDSGSPAAGNLLPATAEQPVALAAGINLDKANAENSVAVQESVLVEWLVGSWPKVAAQLAELLTAQSAALPLPMLLAAGNAAQAAQLQDMVLQEGKPGLPLQPPAGTAWASLALPDGRPAQLLLLQDNRETQSFTVRLIDSQGQTLLSARLLLGQPGDAQSARSSMQQMGRSHNQPNGFIGNPQLIPALPPVVVPTQAAQGPVQSPAAAQFLTVMPWTELSPPTGELTRLLAEQGQPKAQQVPASQPLTMTANLAQPLSSGRAGELVRNTAGQPVVSQDRIVAVPETPVSRAAALPQPQQSQRSVAIPVPMPQTAEAVSRQAALPDAAASLRPQAVIDGWSRLPQQPVRPQEAQASKGNLHAAGSLTARTQAAGKLAADLPESSFTALQRVAGQREAKGIPPLSLGGNEWLGAAAQASGAASPGQPLVSGLPGMQFLSSGLVFSAMAERVMNLAQSARSAGNGLYEARLELNPPQLGRMLAQIAVRGEQVAVQLAVASSLPRRQLEDGLAQLKRSLEAAGLEVAGLRVVSLDPEREGGRGQGGQQQAWSQEQQKTKRLVWSLFDNEVQGATA